MSTCFNVLVFFNFAYLCVCEFLYAELCMCDLCFMKTQMCIMTWVLEFKHGSCVRVNQQHTKQCLDFCDERYTV